MTEADVNQHHFEKRYLAFTGAFFTSVDSGGYVAVASGDVDGDGKDELAATIYNTPAVAIMVENGSSGLAKVGKFAVNTNGGIILTSVTISDVNNDNNLDIVTAQYSSSISNYYPGSVSILLGNGAGAFGAANHFALTPIPPTSIAVGDFNGDGNMDLVTANAPLSYISGSGSLSVLLGNGAGGFGVANNTALAARPASIAVGDFNGDANIDLATANSLGTSNSGNGTVSILLGDGTGAFGVANNFSADPGPVSIALGDFNGDGNLDIVTAHSVSNTISVQLGDGAGKFRRTSNFAVGANPISVAVADFDKDGNLDIVTANSVSNNVSVLLGDGKGFFKRASNFVIALSPTSMVVADINGDNKSDIITAGYSGISTLINQSASSSISTSLASSITASSTLTPSSSLSSSISNSVTPSGSVTPSIGNGSGSTSLNTTAPSINSDLTLTASNSLDLSPSINSKTLSITTSAIASIQSPLVNSSLKTSNAAPSSSGESSTISMSNSTLALLMMAPVGGLLLLIMVFGAFFYRRYQNKIEKNEQYKDLPMLPIKRKSNDEKIELLIDNEEEYSTEIDAEMQDVTIETDSQEQEILKQFAKNQQFFKSSQAEHETATVQFTHCAIS